MLTGHQQGVATSGTLVSEKPSGAVNGDTGYSGEDMFVTGRTTAGSPAFEWRTIKGCGRELRGITEQHAGQLPGTAFAKRRRQTGLQKTNHPQSTAGTGEKVRVKAHRDSGNGLGKATLVRCKPK